MYVDHVLISNEQREVLLVEEGGGWSLPHWGAPKHYFQDVEQLNSDVRRRLGLTVTTLRCLSHARQGEQVDCVYEMENHSPLGATPEGSAWCNEGRIKALRLSVPRHRDLLRSWFADRVTEARRPWARPGWWQEASEWILTQLEPHDLAGGTSIVQRRTWERSCLLHVTAGQASVYFKAVPPMFGHEPLVTQALAGDHPDHIPPVLALEEQRRWALFEDVGAHSLAEVRDVTRWERALRTFSEIQLLQVARVPFLQTLGCPRRPVVIVQDAIGELLHDRSLTLQGQPGGLSDDETIRLKELVPTFSEISDRLGEWAIPETIEHGDFNVEQIISGEEGDVFIDWSDCSISHPFFSLVAFSDREELGYYLPDPETARTRLRAAYLEPWTSVAPMNRLIPAFEGAQQLAPLHLALMYVREILPRMEARWEMERMVPFYLKLALAMANQGASAGGATG